MARRRGAKQGVPLGDSVTIYGSVMGLASGVLGACNTKATTLPGILHELGANFLRRRKIKPEMPNERPPKSTSHDGDLAFNPTLQLYDVVSKLKDEGVFSTVKVGFNQVYRWSAQDILASPSAAIPAIRKGIQFEQPDGTWGALGDGYWEHHAIAGAIAANRLRLNCLYHDGHPYRACCCDPHILHYRGDFRRPYRIALVAGAATLIGGWASTRVPGESGGFWPERKSLVPAFPPEQDYTYCETRLQRAQLAWEKHGRVGNVREWDPENLVFLHPYDKGLQPWYAEYGRRFLENPRVQSTKGFSEILHAQRLVDLLTSSERRLLEARFDGFARNPAARA
jgi:hypothetical protein